MTEIILDERNDIYSRLTTEEVDQLMKANGIGKELINHKDKVLALRYFYTGINCHKISICKDFSCTCIALSAVAIIVSILLVLLI
jgi:hypothetical protein